MRSMPEPSLLAHPDRLFPPDPTTRRIAQRLYAETRALPIISPHGHVPPEWLADNAPFADPTHLLLQPDHYVLRMLHANGADLSEMGRTAEGFAPLEEDAARSEERRVGNECGGVDGRSGWMDRAGR